MVTNSTNLSKLNNHLSPQIIGYENQKENDDNGNPRPSFCALNIIFVPTLRSSSDTKCVLPQQMLD